MSIKMTWGVAHWRDRELRAFRAEISFDSTSAGRPSAEQRDPGCAGGVIQIRNAVPNRTERGARGVRWGPGLENGAPPAPFA